MGMGILRHECIGYAVYHLVHMAHMIAHTLLAAEIVSCLPCFIASQQAHDSHGVSGETRLNSSVPGVTVVNAQQRGVSSAQQERQDGCYWIRAHTTCMALCVMQQSGSPRVVHQLG